MFKNKIVKNPYNKYNPQFSGPLVKGGAYYSHKHKETRVCYRDGYVYKTFSNESIGYKICLKRK